MGGHDDDPASDWAEAPRTVADDDAIPVPVEEPTTAAHEMADILEEARRRGYEDGYNAGYLDGRSMGERDGERRINRGLVDEVLDQVRAAFLMWNLDVTLWLRTIAPWVRARLRHLLPP